MRAGHVGSLRLANAGRAVRCGTVLNHVGAVEHAFRAALSRQAKGTSEVRHLAH